MNDAEWPARCPACMEEVFTESEALRHVIRHLSDYLWKHQKLEPIPEETPRGVLVRERIAGRRSVDLLTLDSAGRGVIEPVVQKQLRAELRYYGEGYGFAIGEDSMRFVDFPEPKRLSHTFGVEWCPDPTKGCEFRGGALDGIVQPMPIMRAGRPPERFTLPVPMEPSVGTYDSLEAAVYGPQVLLSPTQDYSLAGIDSMRDRWVYEAVGR
jgi:hypothetical protein